MYNNRRQLYMIVHAVIPARSGSKGIPNKNIKDYCGKPLLAHSIDHAIQCKPHIDRVIVSTDSEEYAEIARQYGAEVPFLRPSEISGDLSTDYEFIKHYLDYIDEIPDLIVQLRPTYPNRKPDVIIDAISRMANNRSADSLRSVVKMEKSPYKMYRQSGDRLLPLFYEWDGLMEPYNSARQLLPDTYLHNGYIDIIRSDCVLKKGSISGDYIIPFEMDSEETDDIDTYADLNRSANKCL